MTAEGGLFPGPRLGGQLWLGVRAGHRHCLAGAKRFSSLWCRPRGCQGAEHGTPGWLSWGLGLGGAYPGMEETERGSGVPLGGKWKLRIWYPLCLHVEEMRELGKADNFKFSMY